MQVVEASEATIELGSMTEVHPNVSGAPPPSAAAVYVNDSGERVEHDVPMARAVASDGDAEAATGTKPPPAGAAGNAAAASAKQLVRRRRLLLACCCAPIWVLTILGAVWYATMDDDETHKVPDQLAVSTVSLASRFGASANCSEGGATAANSSSDGGGAASRNLSAVVNCTPWAPNLRLINQSFVRVHVTAYSGTKGVSKMWVHNDKNEWNEDNDDFDEDDGAYRIMHANVPRGENVSYEFNTTDTDAWFGVFVLHDKDENGKMKTNWYGAPKEGCGASNGASGGPSGGPSWNDAKFWVPRQSIVDVPVEMWYS
jgi:uncharacterized protein (DUF2141 family)